MPFVIVSRTIGVFLSRKSRVVDIRDRQITPYLPNEMFSVKSTQYISLKAYKKLYITSLWTHKPCRHVAASAVTDTHTHSLTE